MLWLVIILNLLISCWNAIVAGVLWEKSKNRFNKFLSICALGTALVGLYYSFILIGVAVGVLGVEFLWGSNVILGLPIVFFGIVITIDGWIKAIEQKSILAGLVSIYNTFATVRNIRVWIDSLRILSKMGGLKAMIKGLKGRGRSRGKAILFLMIAAIIALLFVIGLFYAGRKIGRKESEADSLSQTN